MGLGAGWRTNYEFSFSGVLVAFFSVSPLAPKAEKTKPIGKVA